MMTGTPGDDYRIRLLYTLNGAAFAVLFSILFLTNNSSGERRTDINATVPITVFAAAVGYCVGQSGIQQTVTGRRTTNQVIAVAVLVLTALLGGIAGWIVGAAQARNLVEELKLTQQGTAIGTLTGPLLGVLVLIPRWIKRPAVVSKMATDVGE